MSISQGFKVRGLHEDDVIEKGDDSLDSRLEFHISFLKVPGFLSAGITHLFIQALKPNTTISQLCRLTCRLFELKALSLIVVKVSSHYVAKLQKAPNQANSADG